MSSFILYESWFMFASFILSHLLIVHFILSPLSLIRLQFISLFTAGLDDNTMVSGKITIPEAAGGLIIGRAGSTLIILDH